MAVWRATAKAKDGSPVGSLRYLGKYEGVIGATISAYPTCWSLHVEGLELIEGVKGCDGCDSLGASIINRMPIFDHKGPTRKIEIDNSKPWYPCEIIVWLVSRTLSSDKRFREDVPRGGGGACSRCGKLIEDDDDSIHYTADGKRYLRFHGSCIGITVARPGKAR